LLDQNIEVAAEIANKTLVLSPLPSPDVSSSDEDASKIVPQTMPTSPVKELKVFNRYKFIIVGAPL